MRSEVHPAAAVFPMLSDDELQALADDIAANGLMQPIIRDRAGVVLDGRNRLAACERAGVMPKFETYAGDDPVAVIVSANIKRRHLDAGQRAFVALALLPFYEEQAARRVGGRPSTKPGADLHSVSQPKSATKAAKVAGASPRNVAHAKALAAKAPDLAAAVIAGSLAIDAAASDLRKREAKRKFVERLTVWDAAASTAGDRIDLRLGDFRDVLADLEPGSVDAIITDPPYPDEFLPLWSDLAEWAAKVLRPGAPMFAWSGQYRLPVVLASITEHLDYRWTICLDLPGTNSRFRVINMIQTWKPIIVATAGTWGPHDWCVDRVISPTKQQELYEWQQNREPAAEIIRRYVPEGGLIVDPFAGVGSFGAAAVALGRRFIGAELDPERHRTASGRIAEALQ